MGLSFRDKIISSRGDLLYSVRGTTPDGSRAWYYLLVDKPKLDKFLQAMESGNLDLADYGEVIESGWGEEPPEEVKELLKEKYGFDVE